MKHTVSRPSASAARSAAIRWPWWTGSKLPPSSPVATGRPVPALAPHVRARPEVLPQVRALLFQLLAIADRAVRLHQLDEGVRDQRRRRIFRDHPREVEYRRVVRAA